MTARTNVLHRFGGLWRAFSRSGAAVPVVLLVAGLGGLLADQWNVLARQWNQSHQPQAVYEKALNHGIAISLRALESHLAQQQSLPAMEIQGFAWDQQHSDWIIFGNADDSRPGLPVDAIIIALHAIRGEVEAPSIDIRPTANGERPMFQAVSYFGGINDTVVGQWFFDFDFWMKRASLGVVAIPAPNVPSYWQRSLRRLDDEAADPNPVQEDQATSRCRFWLCADKFEAIEDGGVMVFKSAQLHVLDEEVANGNELILSAQPSKTKASDPLANLFAGDLTEHLDQLDGVTPLNEIRDFGKLMAGLAWLAEIDPYYDLRPWINANAKPIPTPTTVETLSRTESREIRNPLVGSSVNRTLSLELSGGVIMQPQLIRYRSSNNAVAMLRDAILAARPADEPMFWRFSFVPNSPRKGDAK